MNAISIDIGSTYTKGALFNLSHDSPTLIRRTDTPTTQKDLTECFNIILESLNHKDEKIFLSSSAKGGLSIVAIGLVPDLTLKAATLTASSAGGKIVKTFSYELTEDDIDEIILLKPDIILFSGGTDGGNKRYNLHNAELLQDKRIDSLIIYAGNNRILHEISHLLKNNNLFFTENLMPEVGKLNIRPAHEKIRDLFLETIIHGKGLTEIIKKIDSPITPTPLSIFNLISLIPQYIQEWHNLSIIDLGGATTDCYSHTIALPDDSIIRKGLHEPQVKRTVEGDLGMRVSAAALYATANNYIHTLLEKENISTHTINAHLLSIEKNHAILATSKEAYILDKIFATACIYYAYKRHSGTQTELYTPSGKQFLQKGKDIRNVSKLLATGGYLSQLENVELFKTAFHTLQLMNLQEKDISLFPQNFKIYKDNQYLLPLISNISYTYPKEATQLALEHVENLGEVKYEKEIIS